MLSTEVNCSSWSVSTGLVFQHADGSQYGLQQPRQTDVCTRVFSALRNLGFRETEARRALAQARLRSDPSSELEPLLRAALAELAPH